MEFTYSPKRIGLARRVPSLARERWPMGITRKEETNKLLAPMSDSFIVDMDMAMMSLFLGEMLYLHIYMVPWYGGNDRPR